MKSSKSKKPMMGKLPAKPKTTGKTPKDAAKKAKKPIQGGMNFPTYGV